MELCGIELTPSAKTLVANWQNDAYTVVAFAQQQNILALLAISDPIKSGSPEAIAQLKARGLRVLMLTGDNPITAQSVARRCGIDELQAGLLPSGKAAVLRQLHTEGQKIAMVGDGINDSEALALADLSIAMGKGSDIALEVSKMALLSADLRQIPKALDLSKATVRTIRQNLFWAFIYNLIGIPIAAGILYPFTGYLINPMIAGAAMALSSVSVVSNSLRLRNI